MGLSKERYLELQLLFSEISWSPSKRRCPILDYAVFEDSSDRAYDGFRMHVVEEANAGINELLNWTNHFASVIEDYSAWSEVLDGIADEQERLSTLFEIISPLSFLALSFPAAIKGKLVFVCARMVRDTFKVKSRDGSPLGDYLLNERKLKSIVKEIAIPSMRTVVEDFVQTLVEIDGKPFREITSNYRNRANHGIAPYIEIGERIAFARTSGSGYEGFTFGIEKAIKLNTLVDPLVEQHLNCRNSVVAFLPVLSIFRENWRI